MSNRGKYEELNALVVNIRERLKEGAIQLEEAKRLLGMVYEDYLKLEEEEEEGESESTTDEIIALLVSYNRTD